MIKMLVYGRNVAKELLENGKTIQKIILQDGFSDKESSYGSTSRCLAYVNNNISNNM